MLDLRKLYGKVTIEGEDFGYNQNPGQQEKIFLEYYKTKNTQTNDEKKYGMEILIENKVTPITTKDVITDLKLDPSMIYSRM